MAQGIIDQLNDWLSQNLQPYFEKMPLWFPLIMGGIVLGIVIVVHSMRTSVKIDESKEPDLPDAGEWEGSQEPGLSTNPPATRNNGGGADLEGRLIAALANAPWMVKEGSEIALSKRGNGEWGIETNKIVFALEPKKEMQSPQPESPFPEIPPPPDSEKEEVG